MKELVRIWHPWWLWEDYKAGFYESWTGKQKGLGIVSELVEMGKSDRWIMKHIGMSPDELLRLKQITGVAALFANADFSASWEPEGSLEDEDFEGEDS